VERVSAGRFRRALTPARKRAWRPFFVFISGLVAVLIAGSLWLNFHRSHSPPAQSQRKFEAKYFADRARETLDREHSEPNLRSAEQLMRRALALDPASAAFHAELSRVLSKIYWHILPDEDVEREARTEAEAALKLDPGLAISHLAMAEYHFRCRRDYPAALHSVEKAGQLDPRDGTVPAMAALVLKRLNRWDDALKNNRRACELEPSAPRFYDLAVTCDILRRYTEALEAIGRARYLAPDNPTHTLLHAWLLFRAQGDGSGLERIVAVLPFEQQMSPQYFDTVFLWLLWAHRPAEALRLADALPDDYAVRRYDAFLLKPYFVGLARRAAGDEIGATTAFQTTREILEDRARKYPNDARIRGQLGVVYGYLGLSADAVREGEHAVQLLSLAQEPVGGSYVAAQLAEIFALVGEGDKAIAIVRQLLDRPGYLTVHELKLDPRWDKLRSAVDFQRLTVSPRR
jgi:tetratricopeptide (TPR) repeat protein